MTMHLRRSDVTWLTVDAEAAVATICDETALGGRGNHRIPAITKTIGAAMSRRRRLLHS